MFDEGGHPLRKIFRKVMVLLKKNLLGVELIHNLDYYRHSLSLASSGFPLGDANEAIRTAIETSTPFMAARLGRGEIRFLSKVLLRRQLSALEIQVHRLVEGEDMIWSGKDGWFKRNLQGSVAQADKFLTLYQNSMQKADLLGSWSPGESLFSNFFHGVKIDSLSALEPFRHAKPWSGALEGKRVLLVHPFTKTIRSQYNNRRVQLFDDPRVLPNFELVTLAPFMLGIRDAPPGLDLIDQFETLAFEMASKEADVVIIGAGPLGFLLAAEAKRLGRVAVHLGGATQLLFGITGKRWEESESFTYQNDYWIRPLPEETPTLTPGEVHFDNGAYW